VYVFHELEDNGLVRRAAIAPSARNQAMEVGRAAFGAATEALTAALDSRAGFAGRPSMMIAGAAVELALGLGLPESEIERIRVASMLHDLGKLAIPEEILRKPGALSDAERVVLERHPQIGYRMLESLGVDPVAQWVLHHYERWDGNGYPDKLAGEEIPLGARIIFVADAYDAMTSDRVYRGSLSREDALAELERCAGSQFDPAIVGIFVAELAPELEDEAVLAS